MVCLQFSRVGSLVRVQRVIDFAAARQQLDVVPRREPVRAEDLDQLDPTD
jgi:hypothetical protein